MKNKEELLVGVASKGCMGGFERSSGQESADVRETSFILSQKGLIDKIKQGEKEDPKDMDQYHSDEEW